MEIMRKTNPEMLKEDINKKLLALSSEGEPVFPERVAEIVDKSLKENKPILFSTISCRVSKLSGHAERRFSTPDIIWTKERNDQPVKITCDDLETEGLNLINPKLGLVFAEIPQTLKRVSNLGIPWKFSLIVGDDPPEDVRRSLARLFKDRAPEAFELMSHLHLESTKRVFSFGLENAGLDPANERIKTTSFSQTDQITIPSCEKFNSLIDTMATIAKKLTSADLSGLPKDILKEEEAATTFFHKMEPQRTCKEIRQKVLTEFIPEKVLAGVLIDNLARKGDAAGAIILSAIGPEPLIETQSIFLSDTEKIPVLFPFKNIVGESRLGEVPPCGVLVSKGNSWFSVAQALTWDLLKWLNAEIRQMNPDKRKIAMEFMPTILGNQGRRPYQHE